MFPTDFENWVDTFQDYKSRFNRSVSCRENVGVDSSSLVEQITTPYRLPGTVFAEVSFPYMLCTLPKKYLSL